MATEIYLGNPPQHVIDWIKAHSKPAGNPKTKITFTDGTSQEYDWSGTIVQKMMIDDGLFDQYYLTWIKIPQDIKIGTNITKIGNEVFSYCASLTTVTIPDGVTSIGNMAFSWCTSLTDVTIGKGVTSIGSEAFSGCRGLTNVTIPDGVTSIGELAFSSCSGLTSVTIPDGVTSIGMEAFSSCSELTSVTITANGGDAANVKQMMIAAGVSEGITWNMPS